MTWPGLVEALEGNGHRLLDGEGLRAVGDRLLAETVRIRARARARVRVR